MFTIFKKKKLYLKLFGKCIVIILLAIDFSAISNAQSIRNKLNNKTTELKAVTTQIKGLQNSLSQDRNQQVNLQTQLQKLETNVARIGVSVTRINTELSNQNGALSNLHLRQYQYKDQLNHQRMALTQDIRTAYMLNQHGYIKLLLSQQNPNQISRTFAYYKYANMARLKIMSDLNQTNYHLKLTKNLSKATSKDLQQLILQHQQQQTNLASTLPTTKTSTGPS